MFFIVEFKNRSAGFAVIFVGKLKSSSTSAAVILFAAVDGFDPDFFAGLEAVAQRKAERAVVAPLIETCVGVVLCRWKTDFDFAIDKCRWRRT